MSVNILTQKWAQRNQLACHYNQQVTSTNDLAKEEFEKKQIDFELYLADSQTHGRGRGSNGWEDLGGGEALLSTWCFRLKKGLQPIVTPLLGLAVEQTLSKAFPKLELRIKPPNDIHTKQGKLCGLLVEMSQTGDNYCLYIGLGLNVSGAPKIDTATSYLSEFTPANDDQWFAMCTSLKSHFEQAIDKGQESELSQDDQALLLNAINRNLPETQQYKAVSSHCDLEGPTGTTPWTDL